ncbi:Agroclavine dehydrogenase [Psilocybe cubensis]|uniref:Agroclavine dehydrogenase n=2 Tax=Psilocybe cubensis TaxID=181762 RepID=A0ACB8HHB3_PSICU|nr:Agroclavine dehydrogenase [Psilocybe cubensis]KAH9487326.1 Agroclavine dehydrogenase [Psilocybe cubensis]
MTTLITGGTGKTGLALAKLLHAANRSLVIATRAGEAPKPFKAIKFDWFNSETHEAALSDNSIDRVYIVGPPGINDPAVVISFIDLAISKGVKRFVLLSASQYEPSATSETASGVIHQHLLDKGVDYAILRPTWFIQNFGYAYANSIKERNEITSSAQDGRIPFISTEDIAQAAFESLTAEKSPNKDIFIVGPEALSYDDAAKIASSVLGRPIVYKRVTIEEQLAFYISLGIPSDYSKLLAELDADVVQGREEAIFKDKKLVDEGRKFVGRHTVLAYFQENKDVWTK